MFVINRRLLFIPAAVLMVLAVVAGLDVASSLIVPYDRPARPRDKTTFVVSSPTRVHQLIPNASFTYNGAAYQTNSLGFRDREFSREKPAGTFRVIVLGDSFVEGMGEKQEDTIPKVLEAGFMEAGLFKQFGRPVEVLNAGVRGGSPAVYQYWIRSVAPLSPDALVICIFDNDMDDDACALLTKAYYRAHAWWGMPAVLRRSNLISTAWGELANIRFKFRRAALSQAVFNEPDFRRENRRQDGDENAVGSNGYGFLKEPDRWKKNEWPRTESHLNTIRDYCQTQHIPVLFVHIPSNIFFPQKTGQEARPLYPNVFGGWLSSWANQNGAAFIDLVEPMARWYRQPQNPALYQTTHSHFNAAGLRRAAEEIEPRLTALLKTK